MSVNTTPELTGKRKWFALMAVAVGVAMIVLDGTVVNVALPTMIDQLSLSTTDAEWVTAVYSLVFASLLILFGRLGDLYGRRLMFVLGVAVFIVASGLVAASDTGQMLISARVLQGIGGAMILPTSLSVINTLFHGKDRAIAFAVWGGTIGGFAALGPLVGGWLTTYYSWHWAFLINIPIGIAVIVAVMALIPETKDAGKKGVDVPGTLLVTLGLAGIVFALIEGQHYGWIIPIADFTLAGWAWPLESVSIVLVALLAGIAALLVLLPVEAARARAGKTVVIDLRLFRIKSFSAGNIVALVVSLGEFGVLFGIPLFLQAVRGYDAMQTGVILLALAGGTFIASGAGAPLSRRLGPVGVLRIGMVLEVIGIFGLGFAFSPEVTGWQLAPWLFVYGMGIGFATAQLTGVILADVPVTESGQGSAIQSTSRQVGAAIGTAIIGTVLILGLGTTQGNLEAAGVPTAQAEQITQVMTSSAGQAYPALVAAPGGDLVAPAATDAFVTAVTNMSYTAGAFVVFGLLTSFLLPNVRRPDEEVVTPAA